MRSDYDLAMAHTIRIQTNSKYDIVDVLEMHPYRRKLLAASILLENDQAEEARKEAKKNNSPKSKKRKR